MHLRDAGFRTDTRQYLTAHQLLLSLATKGKRLDDIVDEASLKDLISYLSPIFCKSPEEQSRFEDVLKGWLKVTSPKSPPSNIVRKYADPTKWLPLWSKLGRLIVGFVIVLLAVGMLYYWFVPVVCKGQVMREDTATGKEVPETQAKISFKGSPLKLDNDGRFELNFARISLPGELVISKDNFQEVKRLIDASQPSPIRIVLRQKPEPPQADPQEAIKIGKPLVLTLPRGPAGGISRTEWPMAVSTSAAAGAFGFMFLLVADRIRRRLVLKRLPAEKRPDLHTLAAASHWPVTLSGQQLRRLVGGLRRPREQDALELDPTQTARASARAAGLFSPIFVHRKQMPEYLVLISRRSAEDHQACMIDTLMEQLEQNDVSLVRYFFQNDPQVCRSADNHMQQWLLSELAVIHHACTLFICAESDLCFDPISGKPESWVKKLEQWPRRVLFTPEPPYHWTRREWQLTAEGMIILPASAAGLQTYAQLSKEWHIEMLYPAAYSRPFPSIIGSVNMRWVDRKAPPPETIEKLISQLRGYLGPAAFVSLCACAVYPEISLPLTLYLAGATPAKSGSDGSPDQQLEILSSLSRLPWFKYGYMPNWLRLTLINQLSAEQEVTVRRRLEALLKRLVERRVVKPGKEGLHVAAWVEPKDILKTAPPNSPMEDSVFLGYMSGASLDRLVVDAPHTLGRWFQRLRTLPDLEIPKAPRTPVQRLTKWLKRLMTFRRNLVRGMVSAVLSALVLLWAIPFFTEKTPVGEGIPKIVESVAFAPDGKTLASAGDNQAIKLWDVTSGREVATLRSAPMGVNSVAFSPNGRNLASGSDDKKIKLWDVSSGQEIATLAVYTARINSVTFSKDGRTLASGGDDRAIRLWDAASGRKINTLIVDTARINSLAFSPDGKILASGNSDQTIKLWDVGSGQEIRTLKGHTAGINSVAFSPVGGILASGSSDQTIKMWDAVSGRETRTLKGHTAGIYSVTFSPDGKILASGDGDSTIILWNVTTGQNLRELKNDIDNGYRVDLALNSDGDMLAAGIGDRIFVWPMEIKPSKLDYVIPSVISRPLADARRILEEASLAVGKITTAASSRQESTQFTRREDTSGIVVQQSPAPGSKVKEGLAVDLVVTRDSNINYTTEQFDVEQKQIVSKVGKLFLETVPEEAQVRILNIKPKFVQGMELEPGRYHLEVAAEGYETERRWIDLVAGNEEPFRFKLTKKSVRAPTSTRTKYPTSDTQNIEKQRTLIEALKDPDSSVRANAARELGKIGPDAKAAVPVLIKALKDSDENVRRAAESALENIGYGPSKKK